jgi:pimeloyl-ACP methyl ester carboxylesterase
MFRDSSKRDQLKRSERWSFFIAQPIILLSLLLAVAGCGPSSRAHRNAADRSFSEPSEGDHPAPEPAGETIPDELPPLVVLEVPGFASAVLAVPAARGPRPVLIGAHGAGDSPEWQCEVWRRIVGHRGFVLCPRGTPISYKQDYGYYYKNHLELEKEVLAALDALGKSYPERADTHGVVYTGYSQGATFGALMVVGHAARFPRLILIEGGFNQWPLAVARRYAKNGGARVLFACGGRGCNARAQKSAEILRKADVVARAEYIEHGGHTYAGAVGERVAQSFDWLVEGDVRWDLATAK